jgi:hypothetical protein
LRSSKPKAKGGRRKAEGGKKMVKGLWDPGYGWETDQSCNNLISGIPKVMAMAMAVAREKWGACNVYPGTLD